MFIAKHLGAGPAPTDDFWYAPVGTVTAAGARVTADTALAVSTIYKCVRAIAETVGMLPLPVYRRLQRGKERAPNHPIARLLRRPNPWQTGMQWRGMMQAHAAWQGNGYSEIVVDARGEYQALVPLDPQAVKVEVLPNGLPRYRYTPPGGKSERVLVFGQVLHLQGFAVDGYVGLNPIAAEREAIGSSIATRDYGARFFANDATPPIWASLDGKFESEEAKRKWLAAWRENYGGKNRGKMPVLEKGFELHQLAPLSNADAEFMALRKYQDVDLCGLWRVPPHKVGILDQAKWANIEHQSIDWVTDGVLPWCRRWEEMLLRDLDFGEDDEYFPEHLIDMLLRGDTKTRYEAYGKAIQDGWLLRNEAREAENRNPLPGLDEPLEPLNMQPAGSRRAAQERGEPPAAARREQGARAVLVMTASAERIARKEAAALQKAVRTDDVLAAASEFFAQHARFVADVMAVSIEAAERYCVEAEQRVRLLQATGGLPKLLLTDWTTVQVAALLRLEE